MDDDHSVYGYHSVEGYLLVSILRWIEQNDIKSEMLENKAEKLFSWLNTFEHGDWGNCTEHLMPDINDPMRYLIGFNHQITKLDSDYSTKQNIIDNVFTEGGGNYSIYTGPNKEIIFSRNNETGD